MNEYWIEGPPEKFEVGMLVKAPFPGDDITEGVIGYVAKDGKGWMTYRAHPAMFAWLWPHEVAAHCPMMPVKEAKDIANELWKRWLADPQPRVPFDVAWSVEWRERRAGDE